MKKSGNGAEMEEALLIRGAASSASIFPGP